MMKKMKRSEKVFRTLLIAVMGVVLSGVTLATAFAVYEPTIQVEHVWQDKTQVDKDGNWNSGAEAYPSAGFVESLDHEIKDEALATDENGNKANGTINLDSEESKQEFIDKVKQELVTVIVNNAKDEYINVANTGNSLTEEQKPAEDEIVTKPTLPKEPQKPAEGASEEELAQYEKDMSDYKGELEQYDIDKANYDAYYEKYKDYEDYLKLAETVKQQLTSQINVLGGNNEENEKVKELLAKLEAGDPDDEFWTDFSALVNSWKEAAKDDSSGSEENPGKPAGFENVKEQLKQEFADLKLSDETLNGVLDSITQVIGDRTNSEGKGLEVDDLEIINVQTTDVKEGLLDKTTILNPLELTQASENKLKDYDNSLRIEIMVTTSDRVGWIAGTHTCYISMDNGKTWQVNGAGDPISAEDLVAAMEAKDEVVESYLYTYLHVKEPNPVPPETPPVTPPPSESVPVSDPPTSEPPASEPPEVPLDDPETPLDEIELPLEEIPLTADISYLWYMAALISAAGLFFLVRRNQKSA